MNSMGKMTMSHTLTISIGLGLAASVLAIQAAPAGAEPAPAYAVAERIPIADGGFDYATFDPAHRRLYISRSPGVLAMDVDAKTITAHLADGQATHESLVLDGGKMLLITDSASNSAHLVDALTGKLLAEIPTGQKPDAAVFDPASGLALTMNGKSGDATLVDPAKQKAVGTIAVGGGLEFAAADGAGKVFVNIEDQNQIAVLDTKTRAVVARYPLKGCERPTGLAYAPGAGVLISACGNLVAKVLNASTGEEVATLAIGKGPDAVIYDAARKLAFIPCGYDGVLEVIAVRGPKDVAIVQVAKTEPGARTGAVDPKTGKLYLPTSHYNVPATGRPTPIPGTAAILVVAPN